MRSASLGDMILRGRPLGRVLVALLGRLPFTLTMVAAVLAVAASTNTMVHHIGPVLLRQWGFGLADLQQGHLWKLLLAPFQVYRPYMVLTIVASLLFFLGACEYLLGTWRALLCFWTAHVCGYVGGPLLLSILARAGLGWAASLSLHGDVGASAGAFGAVAAAITVLPPRQRRTLFLLLALYLGLLLVLARRVWDFEHAFAFLVGYNLGGLLQLVTGRPWPRLGLPDLLERRQRPGLVAWSIAALGLINFLGAFLLPRFPGLVRLEAWEPFGSLQAPRHLLLASGLALLVLAPALARGRRPAWWAATTALLISLILHLRMGGTPLETFLSLAFLILLLFWRQQFSAPAHPTYLRSGLTVLGMLALLVPLYGILGFYALRVRYHEPFTVPAALHETGARLLFSSAGQYTPANHQAAWFLASIPLAAWGGLMCGLVLILRGAVGPRAAPPEVRLARQLLARHGRSGTSYMTLWRGNSLFFPPQRDCYIAYRVHSDVALALGDPVGPSRSWRETVLSFAAHTRQQGWEHVFYAASPAVLPVYLAAGYQILKIGEEGIIPLDGLEFKGRHWQHVRSAINRAQREGIGFRMYEGGTVPAAIRDQLFALSSDWAAQQKLPPLQFTLGQTEDVDDPNINVAVAIDAEGHVHAFVDWLPVFARQGWVIDLMRRREAAMPGIMDFLIGMSLLAFKGRGYKQVSLATAPLADLDRDENASLLQMTLGLVYERFDTFYRFQSLFEYKEKFQPSWESAYLIHEGVTKLPRIARALIGAHLPDLDAVRLGQFLGATLAGRLAARRPGPAGGAGGQGVSSSGAPPLDETPGNGGRQQG